MCTSLISLDLSIFQTEKADNMGEVFMNYNSLKTIKFSNKFRTNSVTALDKMFHGCTS